MVIFKVTPKREERDAIPVLRSGQLIVASETSSEDSDNPQTIGQSAGASWMAQSASQQEQSSTRRAGAVAAQSSQSRATQTSPQAAAMAHEELLSRPRARRSRPPMGVHDATQAQPAPTMVRPVQCLIGPHSICQRDTEIRAFQTTLRYVELLEERCRLLGNRIGDLLRENDHLRGQQSHTVRQPNQPR